MPYRQISGECQQEERADRNLDERSIVRSALSLRCTKNSELVTQVRRRCLRTCPVAELPHGISHVDSKMGEKGRIRVHTPEVGERARETRHCCLSITSTFQCYVAVLEKVQFMFNVNVNEASN